MRSLRVWLMRLTALFARRGRDRDLSEEIESHLQLHIDDNVRAGMTPQEARRQAMLKFGPLESMKEDVRDRRRLPAVEHLGQDVRFAMRMLRKSPGFTIVAVATVAVGVGVNTGMFTVLNAAAFRPLGVPGAGRLVTVAEAFTGHVNRSVHGMPSLASYSEYRAYRNDSRIFSGMLAYMPYVNATLGGEHPQELIGAITSCNYFDVLEVRPALGREFSASDCASPGASAVAIISDALWRDAFGADPAIVGRTIALNRTAFTVIGVAPPNFNGTEAIRCAFYAPVTMQSALVRDRSFLNDDNLSWLVLIGRLRPGVTIAQARSDLAVIAARADAQHTGRVTHVLLNPSTLASLPEVHSIVVGIGGVILVSVALVLLMACANLANLLLARATTRRREVALRLAIGASRRRVVQQFLVESLILAAIGGAAGSLLSFWGSAGVVGFLLAHLPDGSPQFAFDVSPDLRVLAYAFALTAATGLAFGIVPALRSARTDLTAALKQDDDRSGPGPAGRLRALLVGVQAGVCVVLLVACGLMTRALIRSQTIDVGFNTADIAVVSYDLVGAGYTPAHAEVFQRQLIDRLEAIAGISQVEMAGTSPLSNQHTAEEFSSPTGEKGVLIEYTNVAPGYFALLGVPIVKGRGFRPDE
ncbi:MAG: ABC transporter permease [Vicinamibacterales bacterium]